MRKKNELKEVITDPVELILRDMILNFSRKQSQKIYKEVLPVMIDEYIIDAQFITFFRRSMMNKLLYEVLKESIDEVIIEYLCFKQIDKILENIAEPLALLCAEEEYFDKEGAEIEDAFKDLENRLILEVIWVLVACHWGYWGIYR